MYAVVTAAAICADKTLISLNILNSNEHTHAAQQTREGNNLCRTELLTQCGMLA